MNGNRRALIIATSRYQDSGLRQLRSPATDADELAKVLGDPDIGGFKITLLQDMPEARLRRDILRFFSKATREDTLLLHLSCHGIKDDQGELYFATNDTELEALAASAISAYYVRQQLGASPSRRIVLFLDCCYSGAFSTALRHRAGGSVDLRERFQGSGCAILTASTSMEYAFEGTNLTDDKSKPSVFTRAVVKGLRTGEADRDKDDLISVDDLYQYVLDEVKRETTKQHPRRFLLDVQDRLIIAKVRRTPTVGEMTLVAPLATKLSPKAVDGLDSAGGSGWEELTGRDAVVSRIDVLMSRISYARLAINAKLSDRYEDEKVRLKSGVTEAGETMRRLQRLIERDDDLQVDYARALGGIDEARFRLNKLDRMEHSRSSLLQDEYTLRQDLEDQIARVTDVLMHLREEARGDEHTSLLTYAPTSE